VKSTRKKEFEAGEIYYIYNRLDPPDNISAQNLTAVIISVLMTMGIEVNAVDVAEAVRKEAQL